MKILNAMFSKKLGGIEQVFLDYNQALTIQNSEVLPIIHPKSDVKNKVQGRYLEVKNVSKFDLLAVYRLKKIILIEQPNCIITHGNRATDLFRKTNTIIPIIPVCHNYKFKSLIGSYAIIAITNDLREKLIEAGQADNTIHVIPNMIHIDEDKSHRKFVFREIPVIGVMARFVKKKGIDTFIKSLYELKKRKIKCKAKIAGSGEEEKKLKKMTEDLGLKDEVEFIGWVENKYEYYNGIDIFCLPSNREPFGLVLLEAMSYCKPIVTTDTEGPSEIVDENHAIIVRKEDYTAMSYAIERIIKNHELARNLGISGFKRVQNYSIFNVSRKLKSLVEDLCYKKLLSG
jgi:glycosyltransferase involved in cell wall biosynthesis